MTFTSRDLIVAILVVLMVVIAFQLLRLEDRQFGVFAENMEDLQEQNRLVIVHVQSVREACTAAGVEMPPWPEELRGL